MHSDPPSNKRFQSRFWCPGNSGWSTPRRSLSLGRGSPWAAPSRGPPSVASSMASITERPQRRQPPIKREYSGAHLASHMPVLMTTHCIVTTCLLCTEGPSMPASAAESYWSDSVPGAKLQHTNLGYQVSTAQQEQGRHVAHSSCFAAGVWCPMCLSELCNKLFIIVYSTMSMLSSWHARVSVFVFCLEHRLNPSVAACVPQSDADM